MGEKYLVSERNSFITSDLMTVWEYDTLYPYIIKQLPNPEYETALF